ncbi:MAG: DEAD/DEAH box helicase family protein [bacterium]|nr:DEAD/DEAH box helicase family protein [bacterium]
MWKEGNKLVHPFNPELGIGFVRRVDGRYLEVYFPQVEREVTLAAEGSGLTPLVLPPGAAAVLLDGGDEVEIAAYEDGVYELTDGRNIADADLWPLESADNPIERLANLRLDRLGGFRNRVEGMHLSKLREAGGLGSFLGGRIELFPHQLHTALKAVEMDDVRWLLADAVGLGKTIVACLILSALVRTGRAQRALIVAPSTLTVQWLGELYRKFHQVFLLLDEDRIDSVEADYGKGNNPFDVHPYGVISMEQLTDDATLTLAATQADLDLIVVDEAHRMANPDIEAALAPLVRHAKHALLLSATPLSADRGGFFRLLKLLHPENFSSHEEFDRAVASGSAVFPCTSAVRREDLGNWPPRSAQAIDLGPAMKDPKSDPRAAWISEHTRGWLEKREKALVFVHSVKMLTKLKKYLENTTQTHIATFHEEMTEAQRDIEVARFRESNLPVLLCSEAGTEGRNFQFCDRMIHYDLPFDPIALEQRIGRLDRIGRTKDVEIIYFHCAKSKPDVAGLFEKLDLFLRPSAGLDSALSGIAPALEAAAEANTKIDIDELVAGVEKARKGNTQDVPRVIYSDAYDNTQAEEILAMVPEDLETHMRKFTLGAANDLGLRIVEKGSQSLYYIEMGTSLTIDSIPGVADDARWLGTFSREEAIEKDELEFYASGHPLVEGLLLEFEDGPRGRAAIMEIPNNEAEGAGLLCLFKNGPKWRTLVLDTRGDERPDLAEAVLANLSKARPVKPEDWGLDQRFGAGVRELGSMAVLHAPGENLEAAAFFRFVPEA